MATLSFRVSYDLETEYRDPLGRVYKVRIGMHVNNTREDYRYVVRAQIGTVRCGYDPTLEAGGRYNHHEFPPTEVMAELEELHGFKLVPMRYGPWVRDENGNVPKYDIIYDGKPPSEPIPLGYGTFMNPECEEHFNKIWGRA